MTKSKTINKRFTNNKRMRSLKKRTYINKGGAENLETVPYELQTNPKPVSDNHQTDAEFNVSQEKENTIDMGEGLVDESLVTGGSRKRKNKKSKKQQKKNKKSKKQSKKYRKH